MIDARELRIGNLITRRGERREKITVDLEILKKVQRFGVPYEGIPLTEQWLIDFRFRKHRLGKTIWYTKSCGKHKPQLTSNDIGEDGYSTKLEFIFIDEYDNIKIKKVHQLQNLYFALTAEELIRKEVDDA